jgi:hypothetical protein
MKPLRPFCSTCGVVIQQEGRMLAREHGRAASVAVIARGAVHF